MAAFSASLVIFVIVVECIGCLYGLQHKAGDTIWSIPPNTDFYSNWSNNRFFQIGDTIVFEFQSEFHNVMQVSRREFESCTADNPFQALWVGPATIPLMKQGVYYFICSFSNYCVLGQKLSLTVHHPSSKSPPPLSAPPTPTPTPPSSAPSLWPTQTPAQAIIVAPFPAAAVDSSVSFVSASNSAHGLSDDFRASVSLLCVVVILVV